MWKLGESQSSYFCLLISSNSYTQNSLPMIISTAALLQQKDANRSPIIMNLADLHAALNSLEVASSVLKGSIPTTTLDKPATTATTMTKDSPSSVTCDSLCESLTSCKGGGQGSYCKLANSPSICFGLYWNNVDGKKVACYAGEAVCPETDPIICQGPAGIVIPNWPQKILY